MSAVLKKKEASRKEAIDKIADNMLVEKEKHVMTMFRIPPFTEAKFRTYCSRIVNDLDSKFADQGYRLADRRGKRSDGKGPTLFAVMELLASNRENLSKDDKVIVDNFEELLIELMEKYRLIRDFVEDK